MFPSSCFFKPMPGEMDRSHLARTLIFSGLHNSQRLLTFMRSGSVDDPRAKILSRFGRTVVKVLADASDIPLQSYIAEHTLLPSIRSFSVASDLENHSSQHLPLITRGYIAPNMRFCPVCFKEQQTTFGFSYWLRDHQIHGHFFCIKHQVPLFEIETSPVPGDVMPTLLHAEPLTVEADAYKNPIVQRYLTATLHLAHNSKPLDARRIGEAVIARLLSAGIRHHSNFHRNAQDALKAMAPPRWLRLVLNATNTKNVVPLTIIHTQRRKNWITLPLLAALVYEETELMELLSER